MLDVFTPAVTESDIEAVAAALRRGEISGSFGQALAQFESGLARFVGCEFGVATSSGTTALHLALAAGGIGPGDEVIISSSTNIATALAAVYLGAIPVPADADEGTWTVTSDHIAAQITPRTRAIIPVHLFGNPAPMDEIMALAATHGLLVVEDCAQAHGAQWRGRPVGSFGHMAAFSFYANKIITTGEGGMVVTQDGDLAARLKHLKNLAFTTPRFRHEDLGYNYRLTAFQAALGLSQLQRIDQIIDRRREIAATYRDLLRDVGGIAWQRVDPEARSVHWMAALRVTSESRIGRDSLMAVLRHHGIDARTFFCPMNQQPVLQGLPGFSAAPCPVADRMWQDGLYLPSGLDLALQDQVRVAEIIAEALN